MYFARELGHVDRPELLERHPGALGHLQGVREVRLLLHDGLYVVAEVLEVRRELPLEGPPRRRRELAGPRERGLVAVMSAWSCGIEIERLLNNPLLLFDAVVHLLGDEGQVLERVVEDDQQGRSGWLPLIGASFVLVRTWGAHWGDGTMVAWWPRSLSIAGGVDGGAPRCRGPVEEALAFLSLECPQPSISIYPHCSFSFFLLFSSRRASGSSRRLAAGGRSCAGRGGRRARKGPAPHDTVERPRPATACPGRGHRRRRSSGRRRRRSGGRRRRPRGGDLGAAVAPRPEAAASSVARRARPPRGPDPLSR